jgi:DNA-binding transcriptional regulator PaaX
MSSKRAAGKALWELFGLLSQLDKKEPMLLRPYGRQRFRHLSRPGYYKKLRRFESHGLIKRTATPTGPVFVITPKAKALRKQAITKQNRTDGLSTLIIFDIPQEKRNARDTLRRYLIRSGYTQIRESAFLSPFQIFGELEELIEELKLQKNVSVFGVKP